MSRVDLAELDFFSPEVQECPFSVYQQLQDEAPVWQIVAGDFAAFVEAKRQALPEDAFPTAELILQEALS